MEIKQSQIRLVMAGAFIAIVVLLSMVYLVSAADDNGTRAASDNSYMDTATYIGSDACGTCHNITAYGMKNDVLANSAHAKKMQPPVPANLIANWSIDPVFEVATGVNVTVGLDYNATTGNYTATIDGTNYTIWKFMGGTGWKQRYVTYVNNSRYILPMQWQKDDMEWVPYHLEDWYNGTGGGITPALTRSWDLNCAGCHSTGTVLTQNSISGEWIATYEELNVGCEACHGPGSEHNGDVNKIWKSYDSENCGSCHIRGKSIAKIGGEKAGYPIHSDGTQILPGDDIWEFYTDGAGYWNDTADNRTSKKHHQQYMDWNTTREGGHAKEASGFAQKESCQECHGVAGFIDKLDQWDEAESDFPDVDGEVWQQTCVSCHDVHQEGGTTPNEHQLRVPKEELCVSCHTYGDAEVGDTPHHPQAEVMNGTTVAGVLGETSGSPAMLGKVTCTDCHMPKVAKSAVKYDISSHKFTPLMPSDSIDNNMPDSCTVTCHTEMEQGDAAKIIDTWQDRFGVKFAEAEAKLSEAEALKNIAYENGTLTASLNETYNKAYFNLHVADDGSDGAHNPNFFNDLLTDVIANSEEVIDGLHEGTLKGVITDADNVPAEGVYVYAGDLYILTGADGSYMFMLEPGTYTISTSLDLNETATSITLVSAELVWQNYTLAPDMDGDGTADAIDTDIDGDGVLNADDAFPEDPAESIDTDGDGTGDNADTDDDDDGVLDADDAFPLDATESLDTDGDGTGDNADTDDDADGIPDAEDDNPLTVDVVQAAGSVEESSPTMYLAIIIALVVVVALMGVMMMKGGKGNVPATRSEPMSEPESKPEEPLEETPEDPIA